MRITDAEYQEFTREACVTAASNRLLCRHGQYTALGDFYVWLKTDARRGFSNRPAWVDKAWWLLIEAILTALAIRYFSNATLPPTK